ncbi:MAG: CehA/McbA family metallohydrolase, partial [Verrucomicrobiota bacterium]
ASFTEAAPGQPILADSKHLRSGDKPEWDEFAAIQPNGKSIELKFNAATNQSAATLLLRQDNVKLEWPVELNGKKLGHLFLMEAPLVHALSIPAGTLRDGENTLVIRPPAGNDDIRIGPIEWFPDPLQGVLNETQLEVVVTDAASGQPLPCRLTLLDQEGHLAPVLAAPDQKLAVRPGVVYSGNGRARLGLRAGRYTVHATRGFEYGLDTQSVSLAPGQSRRLDFRITREVRTEGWVSSDTHVHTFTHSRHGDATIDERVITLAGEGIELPIATDHEYLAELAEPARRNGVDTFFTSVIGCETTTAKGHFNSFPIQAGSRVPDFRITDWPKLMENIRGTPGVRVVILNHPRNVHHNFQPFAATNFNAVTGENLRGFEFSFDAIELVNSSALQSDIWLAFHDWFALLNYGYRVTGVGSSDGHDVSRYIVGQGRTYVACDDSRLGNIDVERACENFLRGRALVSMGLLANLRVNQRFEVGDLVTGAGDKLRIEATVQAPSWIRPERVEVFANGIKILERKWPVASARGPLKKSKARPFHEVISWTVPRPKHDVHLVAIATGPGVSELFWQVPRPYQPTSTAWNPQVIGATNPIWIDGDGDGKFTAARAYARGLAERSGKDLPLLFAELKAFDSSVAAQAASFVAADGLDLHSSPVAEMIRAAPEPVRLGFERFAEAQSLGTKASR